MGVHKSLNTCIFLYWFTLLPLYSLFFIKSLISHPSFLYSFSTGIIILLYISNSSFCWGIPFFSTVAVSSHGFLLSAICFPTLHFPSFCLLPATFSSTSLVPLLQQYLCCLKIPGCSVLSYIPHQSSSPTLLLFLPLLPMSINLISETSLHSSPGSVEAGFNVRLLFRSSFTSSTLSSWRPKRMKFWSVLCETDFVGAPESWESM